ncbi:MAG: DUF2232 domain-containing protein [Clostridia bacterium]|nr:DUF2232 domain-containing protein [Clostridia bacterium]
MIGNILSVFSVLLNLCIIPTAWLIYKKKLKFLSGVFLGTFLFLVSFGCSVYGTQLMYGYSPIDYMVNAYFDEVASLYSTFPELTEDQLQMISNILATLKEYYFTYMPSLVVTFSLGLAYVILMLFKGVFALFKKDVSPFGKFCDLRMPKSALFFAIIANVLAIVYSHGRISYGFLNFGSIIYTITAVCGLSVVDFGLRKKIRFSILRALIYVLVFGILTVLTGINVLAFIGMFDAFFNLREIKIKFRKS